MVLSLLISLLLLLGAECQIQDNLADAIIQNVRAELVRPTYSIASIFFQFPTSQQLNNIVLSADSLFILKLIQTVLDADFLQCQEKITYLLEIEGRIKSAIQLKSYQAVKVNDIIRAALFQIRNLGFQINSSSGEITSLRLQEKNDQLKKMIASLVGSYDIFNKNKADLQLISTQKLAIQKIVEDIRSEIGVGQYIVSNKMNQIKEIEVEIQDLQAKLLRASEKRKNTILEVQKKQFQIQSNQTKIRDMSIDLGRLNFRFKNTNQSQALIKTTIQNLQVQSQRLQKAIADGEAAKTIIFKKIRDLQGKIEQKKTQLVYNTLNSLNTMVDTLNKLLPGIQTWIEQLYYQCFAPGNTTIQKIGNIRFYKISGNNFDKYLKGVYEVDFKLTSYLRDYDVTLQPLDIFSTRWMNSFGQAITNMTMENATDFSKLTKFWCINQNPISTGYGTVSSITATQIRVVNSDGSFVQLRLGACTRMETIYSNLPQSGQKILWKATKTDDTHCDAQIITFLL